VQRQEEERREQGKLLERLHATRTDLTEELASVESQFERAMSMVSQLRTRLGAAQDEMDSLHQQMRAANERLDLMEDERGSLLHEVDQSRAALDEIRRSLADACLASGPVDGDSLPPLR
jgi:chromosome segregation ATPase